MSFLLHDCASDAKFLLLAVDLPPFPPQHQDTETLLFVLPFVSPSTRLITNLAASCRPNSYPLRVPMSSRSRSRLGIWRVVGAATVRGVALDGHGLVILASVMGGWSLSASLLLGAMANRTPGTRARTGDATAAPCSGALRRPRGSVSRSASPDTQSIALAPVTLGLVLMTAAFLVWRGFRICPSQDAWGGPIIDGCFIAVLRSTDPSAALQTSVRYRDFFTQDFFLGPANQGLGGGGNTPVDTLSQKIRHCLDLFLGRRVRVHPNRRRDLGSDRRRAVHVDVLQ